MYMSVCPRVSGEYETDMMSLVPRNQISLRTNDHQTFSSLKSELNVCQNEKSFWPYAIRANTCTKRQRTVYWSTCKQCATERNILLVNWRTSIGTGGCRYTARGDDFKVEALL